jgi:hypothetical protein
MEMLHAVEETSIASIVERALPQLDSSALFSGLLNLDLPRWTLSSSMGDSLSFLIPCGKDCEFFKLICLPRYVNILSLELADSDRWTHWLLTSADCWHKIKRRNLIVSTPKILIHSNFLYETRQDETGHQHTAILTMIDNYIVII